MALHDVMTSINELDEKTVQMFIDRLEFRGKDPTFIQYREAYLDKLDLSHASYVLDIGCGTGVVARALVQRPDFSGRVLGVDQSPVFIEAAQRLAAQEGVTDRVAFQVEDVHALNLPAAHFDAIVAHTLMSHVAEPLLVLKEAARVVRPGGAVALFDGDYASWTFACTDHALGTALEAGLIAIVGHNPRVMRDMPHLLRQAGLAVTDVMAYVYADVGKGGFFAGPAEGYAPLAARAGLVSPAQVETWLAEQRRRREDRTFFAACNYYTYIAKRTL